MNNVDNNEVGKACLSDLAFMARPDGKGFLFNFLVLFRPAQCLTLDLLSCSLCYGRSLVRDPMR
jgi:hypothetical protein